MATLYIMSTNGLSLPERPAKKQPVLARADEVSDVRSAFYFEPNFKQYSN